jgi:hypothetical protein
MSSAGLPTTPDPIRSPGGLINTPPGMATTPADNATGFSPVSSVPPTNTIAPSTPIPTTTPAGTTPSGTPELAAPTAYGYNPDAYKVTEDQTVAGQIKNIIASGSPLMKLAETNAKNQMNQRGLINSSQAITAGQAAVYGAATPIATSDAATYAKAAENTTNARNLAMHDTAAAQNAASIAKLQSDTTLTAQDMQDTTSVILKNLDNDTQRWMAQLQSNTQISINDKSVEAQKLIANWNNTSAQVIAGIQSNTALTVDERDNAVKTYLANQDNATKIKLQEMSIAGDLEKIKANGEVSKAVQKMGDDAKLLLNSSSSAMSLWSGVISDVAKVMSDPNLSADQKTTIGNQMMEGLGTALTALGHVAGIDFGDVLTFGGGAGQTPGGTANPGGAGAANPNNAGYIEPAQAPYTGYSGGNAPNSPSGGGGYQQGYNSYGGYNVDASGNVTT